jgi:hypothetical protein
MKLQSQSRSLGASHHLQAWCALVAPNQAPGFELSLANLQSYESGLHSGYSTTDSPSLFHHDDTIEFA